MFIADIKNKLTSTELISEDLLTSAVFSVFHYVNRNWLEQFLNNAINLNQKKLSLQLYNPYIEFWPWFPNKSKYGGGAEPDVIIYSKNIALIIEAKNYAGKSGTGILAGESDDDTKYDIQKIIIDQIGREYYIGAKKILNSVNEYSENSHVINEFYVIFLTRHAVFPKYEIEESLESIAEIDKSEYQYALDHIYWLNWQKVVPIMEQIQHYSETDSCEFKMTGDLIQFLERRNLNKFSGYNFLDKFPAFINDVKRVIKKHVFYKITFLPYWNFIDKRYLSELHNCQTIDIFFKKTMKPYWFFLDKCDLINTKNVVFYRARKGGNNE